MIVLESYLHEGSECDKFLIEFVKIAGFAENFAIHKHFYHNNNFSLSTRFI